MATKRKTVPKAVRMKVYEKYDGHCAYCGRPIAYEDMQVDHIRAKSVSGRSKDAEVRASSDDPDNYNPSCRACNYYKKAGSVESFRKKLSKLPARLNESSFIYRLAVSYGLVAPTGGDVTFWMDTHEASGA